MPQLTEEYLDKKLTELTKDFKGYVDKRITGVEQKLSHKISEETENLARIVNKGFEYQSLQFVELLNQRDERTEQLENDMRKVKNALIIP